jgi:prepilin-type N-terminal cleavage/methylation domain-containing protein
MKTEPHTKPLSQEENPSQRSTPIIPSLRASAPPREFPLPSPFPVSAFRSPLSSSRAFSLVELLVVMAIIGMMVGLSAMAVQGLRAPAVQHAASQVTSGLSLARQIAITKNTQAAFLIDSGIAYPLEPYRHWSVVYSNREANTWTIAKDWEELPSGAVFYEIRGSLSGTGYSSINSTVNTFTVAPGGTIPTSNFFSANSSASFSIVSSGNTATATFPCVRFSSDGDAVNASGSGIAIRIAPGNSMNGNATITGNGTYYFVETDGTIGRVRMRSPSSYR